MTPRRLAAALIVLSVILLGAAAAAALLSARPAGPAGPPVPGPGDAEALIAACIRITREAAAGAG